jgi:hypothetical protein
LSDFSVEGADTVTMATGICKPSQGSSATVPLARSGVTVTRSDRRGPTRIEIPPPGPFRVWALRLQETINVCRRASEPKAAGLESEPAGRIEQRPGRRIGKHQPRCAVHQHHGPVQALKPVRRRVMVEIAYAKFAMDANSALHVLQRGPEDYLLLAANLIVFGRIGGEE